MRRGIFRGIITLSMIFSMILTSMLYQQEQTRDMIQICEDIKIVDIIEPRNIGGIIL